MLESMNADELYIAMNGRMVRLMRGDPAWTPSERRTTVDFIGRVIADERARKLAELGLTYGGMFAMDLQLGFALKQPADSQKDREFEDKRNELIQRMIKEAGQLILDHYGVENVVMGDDLYCRPASKVPVDSALAIGERTPETE